MFILQDPIREILNSSLRAKARELGKILRNSTSDSHLTVAFAHFLPYDKASASLSLRFPSKLPHRQILNPMKREKMPKNITRSMKVWSDLIWILIRAVCACGEHGVFIWGQEVSTWSHNQWYWFLSVIVLPWSHELMRYAVSGSSSAVCSHLLLAMVVLWLWNHEIFLHWRRLFMAYSSSWHIHMQNNVDCSVVWSS